MKRNEEKGETFEFEVSKENFDFIEPGLKNQRSTKRLKE